MGRKHALEIANSLRDVARSLVTLECPAPYKDVSDLLQDGRLLSKLVPLSQDSNDTQLYDDEPAGDEADSARVRVADDTADDRNTALGPFERGDHVELAERLIDRLGPRNELVFDELHPWRYRRENGVWSIVQQEHARRSHHRMHARGHDERDRAAGLGPGIPARNARRQAPKRGGRAPRA